MSKKKRKKFNLKKFFKFLLFFVCFLIIVIYFLNKPIKNIIITGNNYITDETIIETARIEDYPSFLKTFTFRIKRKISKLPLVKSVKVKKKYNNKIVIDIEEYKILFKNRSTGEYVLDDNTKLMDLEIVENVPILINYVPDKVLDKMVKKFSILDKEVITKISEIEYSPTTYDEERFILYMNDLNEVYITLNKIKEFSSYTKIKQELGTHKGVLYLDSGNYFEIKN